MAPKSLIQEYINAQLEAKKKDMETLHKMILKLMPKTKLWFLDGKNAEGKVVSNPNIGYGSYLIKYADGSDKVLVDEQLYEDVHSGKTVTKEFYAMRKQL